MPVKPSPASHGTSYRAWFQCNRRLFRAIQPEGRHLPVPTLWQPPGGAPRSGPLAAACPRRLERNLRQAVSAHPMALRQRRLGQARMGLPGRYGRQRRVYLRGRHQPLLGRAAGRENRGARPVDQAVRQQPHRVVQGLGHDGVGVDGAADDRGGQRHSGGGRVPQLATPRRRWRPIAPSPVCRPSFSSPRARCRTPS